MLNFVFIVILLVDSFLIIIFSTLVMAALFPTKKRHERVLKVMDFIFSQKI